MPPPQPKATTAQPTDNVTNAVSDGDLRSVTDPARAAPDNQQAIQFHADQWDMSGEPRKDIGPRDLAMRSAPLQPYYAAQPVQTKPTKSSKNAAKNAKKGLPTMTADDPGRSSRQKQSFQGQPTTMSRETSQETSQEALQMQSHDDVSQIQMGMPPVQDGRLHASSALRWNNPAANVQQSPHGSTKSISPTSTHSRPKKQPSDSDDSETENLLRYSIGEQVNILRRRVQKLQSKRATDKKTISDQELNIQQMQATINAVREEYDRVATENNVLRQQLNERGDSVNRLQNQAFDNDIEVTKLRNEVRYLKEEASAYQSALGTATNVRWSDDDSNNSVQLTNVINDLQHALSDFAKVKGSGVRVNDQAASKLLHHYKCRTRMSDSHPKPVLSGAIQRRALEVIFDELDKYIAQGRQHQQRLVVNDETLEREIVHCAIRMIELVTLFARTRAGNDRVTEVTAVKLRQQIYAILGSRAFSMFDRPHPFIAHVRDRLLDVVGKYRSMQLDELRQQEHRQETTKLALDVAHLYFRLQTQEPVPEFRKFYESGESLRVQSMTGPWNSGDLEDLVVEICSFPLIGFGDTVLSKAHVHPTNKN